MDECQISDRVKDFEHLTALRTWRESIDVMDEVEISQPLNKYKHLQPSW